MKKWIIAAAAVAVIAASRTGVVGAAGKGADFTVSKAMDLIEAVIRGVTGIADAAVTRIAGRYVYPQSQARSIIDMWRSNGQTAGAYYQSWHSGGVYASMSRDELIHRLIESYGYNDWTQGQLLSNYTAYNWATRQVQTLVHLVGL